MPQPNKTDAWRVVTFMFGALFWMVMAIIIWNQLEEWRINSGL